MICHTEDPSRPLTTLPSREMLLPPFPGNEKEMSFSVSWMWTHSAFFKACNYPRKLQDCKLGLLAGTQLSTLFNINMEPNFGLMPFGILPKDKKVDEPFFLITFCIHLAPEFTATAGVVLPMLGKAILSVFCCSRIIHQVKKFNYIGRCYLLQ